MNDLMKRIVHEAFNPDELLNEYPEMAKLWVCALYYEPNCMEFHSIRGFALYCLKQYQLAKKSFEQALTSPPSNPHNPTNQATIESIRYHLKLINERSFS